MSEDLCPAVGVPVIFIQADIVTQQKVSCWEIYIFSKVSWQPPEFQTLQKQPNRLGLAQVELRLRNDPN